MTGDELARRLDEGTVSVIDVRSREEFTGEAGYPCDPCQGHIAGAVHIEWSELYRSEGRPHDGETIRRLLTERGVDLERDLVVYCHSGQRSTFAFTALRSAGMENVSNYEGSWHDWCRR